MTRKKIFILATAVVVLVLVGILIYLLLGQREEKSGISDLIDQSGQLDNLGGQKLPQDNGDVIVVPGPVQDLNKQVTQLSAEEVGAQNVAKFFVEMLGSYSPDARFQNIIDLKPMMSSNMLRWADDFIERNLPNIEQSDEAITTQVLKTDVVNNQGSRMEILTLTRREGRSGEGVELFNQEAEVLMVKIGDNWKVDSVEWK